MKIQNKPKKEKQTKQKTKLEALVDMLNTKYGAGTAIKASEAEGLKIKRLPTGSVRLDIALMGGFPEGRITEVYGPESSGKSTLMLSTMAQFQRKYEEGVIVFVDLEKSYDPVYASRWGVDTSKVVLINPDSGEQGANVIGDVANAELDMLVIVDSIAAMTPTAEAEASMDQMIVGSHPRLINRTMRVCTARMKRSLADPNFPTTTAIFLNQVREKIGVMFGCLRGDTIVPFTDGTSATIKDVVEQKMRKNVWAYDKELLRYVSAPIINWFNNGEVAHSSDFLHIKVQCAGTKNGRMGAYLTPNHKVLTSDGFMPAHTLRDGSYVSIPAETRIVSQQARAIVSALLVGDCHLASPHSAPFIQLSDSSNPSYVEWKRSILGFLVPPTSWKSHQLKNRRLGTTYVVWDSPYILELAAWKARLGVDRSPSQMLGDMNVQSLALWYMDDGSYVKGEHKYDTTLSVKRLRGDDARLAEVVSKIRALGFDCTSYVKSGTIRFTTCGALAFHRAIAPFVPPCMEYKLPADLAGSYDATLWDIAETVIQTRRWAKVMSVRRAAARPTGHKSKYDIQVEGHSNYLVGGSSLGFTVHNSPETTPGGKGKNFFASLRLRLFMSESKKNRIVVKVKRGGVEKEEVVARLVSFNVVKNKCGGVPFEEGDFKFYLKKADGNEPWSFDNAQALFDYGRYYRLITVDDGGLFSYTSTSTNETLEAKREKEFLALLRDEANSAEVADLYSDIMTAVEKANSGELPVDDADEVATEEDGE